MIFHYYKNFSIYNFLLSFVIGSIVFTINIFSISFNESIKFGMTGFLWGYITIGYLLSLYIFHIFRRRTYFFYYNKGYSILQLNIITYLLNLLIFFVVKILIKIVL